MGVVEKFVFEGGSFWEECSLLRNASGSVICVLENRLNSKNK